jgi:hypothetical protein
MKNAFAGGIILLAALAVAGCASGQPSQASSFRGGGSRCPGPADSSGSQPLFYLLCIQTN